MEILQFFAFVQLEEILSPVSAYLGGDSLDPFLKVRIMDDYRSFGQTREMVTRPFRQEKSLNDLTNMIPLFVGSLEGSMGTLQNFKSGIQ